VFGGMQNFYLNIRKTLLHPWCVETKEEFKKTIEEYNMTRSAKLDTLVEILQHHLAKDGADALIPSRFVPPPSGSWEPRLPKANEGRPKAQRTGQGVEDLPPDKIIVYSYFTSAFKLIKLVSGVLCVEEARVEGLTANRCWRGTTSRW
jgi:hypothetical protein